MKSIVLPELDLIEIDSFDHVICILESLTRYFCQQSKFPGDLADLDAKFFGAVGDEYAKRVFPPDRLS